MDTHTLATELEAILFMAGEPVKIDTLAKDLGTDRSGILRGLTELEHRLKGGIKLARSDESVALVTAPEVSDTITRLRKEALDKDMGAAGLEVLAIVLYRGPSTRAVIDHIRGVNSAWTVRGLVSRGLLERISEGREYLYRATPELMAHLGVGSNADLPKLTELREQIHSFEKKAAPADATEESKVYEPDPTSGE